MANAFETIIATAVIHLPGSTSGFPVGAELTLPAEQAEALIAQGAARRVGFSPPEQPSTPLSPDVPIT